MRHHTTSWVATHNEKKMAVLFARHYIAVFA
jgi:hypothetical protein